MTEQRAPYQHFQEPSLIRHCWDGKTSHETGVGSVQTCCWCGKPQRELVQVPAEGHGPYGPTTPKLRDNTEGICTR